MRFVINSAAYDMVQAGFSITAISDARGDKIALTLANPDNYLDCLDGGKRAPKADDLKYARTLGHRTALWCDNAGDLSVRRMQYGCAQRLIKPSTLKSIVRPMFEHGYFKLWTSHTYKGDPEIALFAKGQYIGLADVTDKVHVRILCVADRTHMDGFDPQPTKRNYNDVDDLFAHFDGRPED